MKCNQNTPTPYYFFILPKYILQFEFVKYKTHKGYTCRTHEFMSYIPYVFFSKNVGNSIKREETYSREACTCDEVMSF